jgi:hypothetical protein
MSVAARHTREGSIQPPCHREEWRLQDRRTQGRYARTVVGRRRAPGLFFESGECLSLTSTAQMWRLSLYPSPPVGGSRLHPSVHNRRAAVCTLVPLGAVGTRREQQAPGVAFEVPEGYRLELALLVVGRRWDPCVSSEVSTRRGPL